MNVRERINELLLECENYLVVYHLPPEYIFAVEREEYNRVFAAHTYFRDSVLRALDKDPEFITQCLELLDLGGTPTEVERRINCGRHPFRDALILTNHSLLRQADKVGILTDLQEMK